MDTDAWISLAGASVALLGAGFSWWQALSAKSQAKSSARSAMAGEQANHLVVAHRSQDKAAAAPRFTVTVTRQQFAGVWNELGPDLHVREQYTINVVNESSMARTIHHVGLILDNHPNSNISDAVLNVADGVYGTPALVPSQGHEQWTLPFKTTERYLSATGEEEIQARIYVTESPDESPPEHRRWYSNPIFISKNI